MIAMTSLALGNGLVVIRVVDLWDHHKVSFVFLFSEPLVYDFFFISWWPVL
jgi:hypothetical protein